MDSVRYRDGELGKIRSKTGFVELRGGSVAWKGGAGVVIWASTIDRLDKRQTNIMMIFGILCSGGLGLR